MDVLQDVPLFRGISTDALDAVRNACKERSYPKNAVVITEGDDTNTLYVLLEGEVKVYVSDEGGREFVLNQLAPGDYFGEFALLDADERTASVMTLASSRFAVLSKPDFDEILKAHVSLYPVIVSNLVARVRQLTDNVKTLALNDVYGRMRKLLTGLADGDVGEVPGRLTQQDIASRIGSSREMVARILKELVNGGYISVEKKHLTIEKALPEQF